ncbi:MAG: flagellar export protein FliJ [Dyella sp.]
MSARSARLQPAVEQAQRRQQDALQRFAAQQQQLAKVQQQMEDLQRFKAEYSLPQSGGLTVTALINRQKFVDRIDRAMTEQRHEIERQRHVMELARGQWLLAHAREKALDSVVTKLQMQEDQAEQRREQAEVDERMQHRRRPADVR